jgi:glycosyltransferase involved in cell wall biosynthesis
LEHYKNDLRLFFFIIGDGTEYNKLNSWYLKSNPQNIKLIKHLPKNEFDEIAKYGQSGLILLDSRFTIPNFPSRLLTYLENKMSVWAATDSSSDIGSIIRMYKIGFWTQSGDLKMFSREVECELNNKNLVYERGKKGFEVIKRNYNCDNSFKLIISHL